MDYNPDCPAWGNLTWPKVGEFNLANGAVVYPCHCPTNRKTGASPIPSSPIPVIARPFVYGLTFLP